MVLTEEQKAVVENNICLVRKVMKDRLHGGNALSYYSYEDLFQIGCIGLCKAAATDKGTGCFSTYAYRLIWNEICDALIFATRRVSSEVELKEASFAMSPAVPGIPSAESLDLRKVLDSVVKDAPVGHRKALMAAMLMAEGYSSREVGQKLQIPANSARSLASRARRYLREKPELAGLFE